MENFLSLIDLSLNNIVQNLYNKLGHDLFQKFKEKVINYNPISNEEYIYILDIKSPFELFIDDNNNDRYIRNSEYYDNETNDRNKFDHLNQFHHYNITDEIKSNYRKKIKEYYEFIDHFINDFPNYIADNNDIFKFKNTLINLDNFYNNNSSTVYDILKINGNLEMSNEILEWLTENNYSNYFKFVKAKKGDYLCIHVILGYGVITSYYKFNRLEEIQFDTYTRDDDTNSFKRIYRFH